MRFFIHSKLLKKIMLTMQDRITETPKPAECPDQKLVAFKREMEREIRGKHTSIGAESEELDRRPYGHSVRSGREQRLLVERLRDVNRVDTSPGYYPAETSGDHDGVRARRLTAASVGEELLGAFVGHEVDRRADGVAQQVQAVAGVETRDATLLDQAASGVH